MTTDCAVQISMKQYSHGGWEVLTNIYAPDSATASQHSEELKAFGATIQTNLAQFRALGALASEFTVDSPDAVMSSPRTNTVPAVTNAAVTSTPSTPPPASTRCPVNSQAWHNPREGVSSKNGKPWKAIFCNNTPECAAVFG